MEGHQPGVWTASCSMQAPVILLTTHTLLRWPLCCTCLQDGRVREAADMCRRLLMLGHWKEEEEQHGLRKHISDAAEAGKSGGFTVLLGLAEYMGNRRRGVDAAVEGGHGLPYLLDMEKVRRTDRHMCTHRALATHLCVCAVNGIPPASAERWLHVRATASSPALEREV